MIDDRLHPAVEHATRLSISTERELKAAIDRTFRREEELGHPMNERQRRHHRRMYERTFRRKIVRSEELRARRKARLAKENATDD
jgi:hypothetical protein